ncbi:RHS repeat-associated core domain-containing protein [Lentisphaerota bacterium WC36G]|nr:hypothetical protein LJT99_15090 [Lentisphaerae bacterium WC36]
MKIRKYNKIVSSLLFGIFAIANITPTQLFACDEEYVGSTPCEETEGDSQPETSNDDGCTTESCENSPGTSGGGSNPPSGGTGGGGLTDSGSRSPCNKGICKAPVSRLSEDGRFYINDIPLWYNAAKGPSFVLKMHYEPSARREIYNNAPVGTNWSISYLDHGLEVSQNEVKFYYGNGKTFTFDKQDGFIVDDGDGYTGNLSRPKAGRNIWLSSDETNVIMTDEDKFHYYFNKYNGSEYRLMWIADKAGDKLKFFYNQNNTTKSPDYAITADNRRFNFVYWSGLTEDDSIINGKLKEVNGPLAIDGSVIENITGTMKLSYEARNDEYQNYGSKNYVLLKHIEDMGGRSFTYDYELVNLSFASYSNYVLAINRISENGGPVSTIEWQKNPYQITLNHPDGSWERVRYDFEYGHSTANYWNSKKGSFENPLTTNSFIYKNNAWRRDGDKGDKDALGRTHQVDRLDTYGKGGLNNEFYRNRPYLSRKIYREVIYSGNVEDGNILAVKDYQYYKDSSQLSLYQKDLTDIYQKFGHIYKVIERDKDGNILRTKTYENLKVDSNDGAVISYDTIITAADGSLISKSVMVPGMVRQWSTENLSDIPEGFYSTFYYVGGTTKEALNNELTKWHEYKSLYNDIGQEYANGIISGDATATLKLNNYYTYYDQGDNKGRIKEAYSPGELPIKAVNGHLISKAGLKKVSYEYDFGGNPILVKYSYYDKDGSETVYETVKNSYNIFYQRIKAEYSSDNTFELWSYACCGLASYTDREGNVILYERDQRKRIVREIRMTKAGRRFMDTRYKLDTSGNRIEVKTMSGAVTKVNYDDANRLISATDELGRTIQYGYDLYDNQIYAINPDSTVKRNFYDNQQRLIHTAMFANETDAKINDINATLASTTPLKSSDDQPLVNSMTYYSNGMVKAQYGPYKHDKNTLTFNENNFSSKFEYELDGSLIKQYTNTAKGVVYVRNEYDNDGKLLKAIGPVLVGATETAKDVSQENIYSETDFLLYTLTAPYTANNDVSELVRNVARYSYDYRFGSTNEIATARVDASNSNVQTANYTVRSTGSFDSRGREVSSTRDGVTTTTAYSEEGNLQKVVTTYADGSTTSQYSEGPFLIKRVSKAGVETVYEYDDAGNRVKITESGSVKQTSSYDKFKRLTAQADALGNTTKYGYNLNNQITEITFADGTKQFRNYNNLGQLVGQDGANTYPLSFTYNANNQMISMTDGNGAVTEWVYNEYGQLVKKLYDGSTVDSADLSYEYDLKGKMISRTDKRGVTTRYWYDNLGQQRGIDYPSLNVDTNEVTAQHYNNLGEFLTGNRLGDDIRYNYDELNRVSQIEDATGLTSFNYEGNSTRLTAESGASATVNYQYTNGMLSKLTAGTDYSIDYSYDLGRLNSVAVNVNGQNLTTNFTYKTNSELLAKQTTISGTNTVERSYTFDDADRLLSINNKSNSNVVSDFVYTLDKLGRRTSITKNGTAYDVAEKISYRYNEKGELIAADSSLDFADKFIYKYDAIGNRTFYQKNDFKINGTYNNLNQIQQFNYRGAMPFKGDVTAQNGTLVKVDANGENIDANGSAAVELEGKVEVIDGKKLIVLAEDSTGKKSSVVKDIPNSESYVYDVNGNLKNDGNYNYYWNCENRLVKMLNTTQKLEFKYDYMGRRREKKVFEKENNEWVLKSHKSFIYNKYKLIKTVDELNNGSISDRFVWLGDNLLALEKDGVAFNYIADGNKNITQLIDMSSGSVANRYDYSPFGQLSKNTETVANVFKFSSEYAEKETGLIYYNYRYYNPTTGKWLNRDPISELTENNEFNLLYGFVNNNPINHWDYLGQKIKLTSLDTEEAKKHKEEVKHIMWHGKCYNKACKDEYDSAKVKCLVAAGSIAIGTVVGIVSGFFPTPWGVAIAIGATATGAYNIGSCFYQPIENCEVPCRYCNGG